MTNGRRQEKWKEDGSEEGQSQNECRSLLMLHVLYLRRGREAVGITNEIRKLEYRRSSSRHNNFVPNAFEFATFGLPRPFAEAKFRAARRGGIYSIDALHIQLH